MSKKRVALVLSFSYNGELPHRKDINTVKNFLSSINYKVKTASETGDHDLTISSTSTLLAFLRKYFLKKHPSEIILYIGGHGNKEGFKMPCGSITLWKDIFGIIERNIQSHKILFVDCCSGPNIYSSNEIGIISSNGDKVVFTNKGSLVTSSIFNEIKKGKTIEESTTETKLILKNKCTGTGEFCVIECNDKIKKMQFMFEKN